MGKIFNLIGKRFGKLLVIGKSDKRINDRPSWDCLCECGGKIAVKTADLISGKISHCKNETNISSKHLDLIGKKFGNLTVISMVGSSGGGIVWHCKCDCGNECDVTYSKLSSGNTKSCGCNKHKKYSNGFNDLTNKRFGMLVAKYPLEERRHRKVVWHCVCACGNEVDVISNGLTSGNTTSCGKHRKSTIKHLVGKVFGELTVMSLAYTKNNKAYWNCKCECGDTCIVDTTRLTSGKKIHCNNSKHRSKPRENLVGKSFNKLTVKSYAGNGRWNCTCSCGSGKNVCVITTELKSGHTKSCGCYHKEAIAKYCATHDTVPRYPQWFINELYCEEDKERAKNGKIRVTENVWFNCTEHGKYIQTVSNHIRLSDFNRLHGCPKCSNSIAHSGSFNENEIVDYVTSICTNNITKERILDINDGGYKKEIDIFIKDLNIGIEYNGSVFHATEGALYTNKPKLYHQQKLLSAKKQGINLISIFDVDWNTNADKIKMYLKSLLVDNKKVFARKCEIKSVDRKIANEFTDKYHLQGHARLSSINYGLYYNDELLSVMSFGRLRLQKTEEGQFELHRYCVKDGYTIVGGANKLLKAFEREHNPKYLLSFSDNDYFMGGIYDKLGFTNDGQSTPRYYWFLNNEEIKREKCQLKHLKEKCPELLQEAYDNNASNKEDYVMLKLGACKVYRSGNTRWIKEYKS